MLASSLLLMCTLFQKKIFYLGAEKFAKTKGRYKVEMNAIGMHEVKSTKDQQKVKKNAILCDFLARFWQMPTHFR